MKCGTEPLKSDAPKSLEDMSLQELWELFPVILVPHQDCWLQWYVQEETFLRSLFPCSVKLHHIGSTAVEGIHAKPIVDILAEVPAEMPLADLRSVLEKNGYICMNANTDRISFNKGYTPLGYADRVFHLHLVRCGAKDEVYFRDYLRAHPKTAQSYEKLKLRLQREYTHDRDGYTEAKTAFIRAITKKAREKT